MNDLLNEGKGREKATKQKDIPTNVEALDSFSEAQIGHFLLAFPTGKLVNIRIAAPLSEAPHTSVFTCFTFLFRATNVSRLK